MPQSIADSSSFFFHESLQRYVYDLCTMNLAPPPGVSKKVLGQNAVKGLMQAAFLVLTVAKSFDLQLIMLNTVVQEVIWNTKCVMIKF
jgi:hypothetical protein